MKKLILILILLLSIAIPAVAGEKAVQVESLWSGVTDAVGLPLSGGLVYTYQAGTTTAKATYTDVDKATPAANPIVLDSEGKALIFADGLYKFVIKDSTGLTTLDTLDDLSYFNQYYTEAVHASDYGDGSCTDETITTAQTAIGSDVRTLVLKPCAWVIDENTAINANVNLKFEAGAVASISTGVTLTINGSLEYPKFQQIFSLAGTGSVSLGTNVKDAYPEMWGKNTAPATTDMTTEIQAALGTGKHVVLTDGIYLSDPLIMTVDGTSLEILGPATLRQQGTGLAANDYLVNITCSNCSVIGQGTLDGNTDNITFPSHAIKIGSLALTANPSHIYVGGGLRIKNTQTDAGNKGDAVYITGNADGTYYPEWVTVEGNFGYDLGRCFTAIIAGKHILVQGNQIDTCGYTCLDIEPNNATQIVEDTHFIHNNIYNANHGIDLCGSYNTAEGNTIDTTVAMGILVDYSAYCTPIGDKVIDNIIKNHGTFGVKVEEQATDIDIEENTFVRAAGSSVDIYTLGLRTKIKDNIHIGHADCTATVISVETSGYAEVVGESLYKGGESTAINLNSSDHNTVLDNVYYGTYTTEVANIDTSDIIRQIHAVKNVSTSPYGINNWHTGWIFTNEGSSGTVQFNLDPCIRGTEIRFIRTDAHTILVNPDDGDKFRGQSNGDYMSLDADGTNVLMKCVEGNIWDVMSLVGSVTYE